MDLIANDLSIHGQFSDASSFRMSFIGFIAMRSVARRWDRDIYCNRQMAQAEPMPGVPMSKAVARYLSEAERRAVMAWFTRGGPFWEDENRHGEGEWIESGGNIVTGSAVGEAAYRSINGVATGLVSVEPSKWNASPVSVLWRLGDELTDQRSTKVQNWWDAAALESALERAAPPLASWSQLRDVAIRRFDRLRFSDRCFIPLAGVPFAKSTADRLAQRFAILNRLAGCFDENGIRTREGHWIVKQYVKGDNAFFSKSSESEMREFKAQLTFPHPGKPGEKALFGWHGKMARQTIRFHFSWPIRAGEPVYIVYVGPKITKR